MNEPRIVLSAESGSVFYEGIGLILSRWSALEAAIQAGFLGRNSRQKVDQMQSDIFSWFTTVSKEPLYIDDLEDMLDDSLELFGIMAEDCSIEEVAEKLMIMHEECLDGNFKSVEALRRSIRTPVSHVKQANDDEEEGEDEDGEGDMMIEGGVDDINDGGSSSRVVGSSNRVAGSSSTAPNPKSEDMQIDDPNPKPSAEELDGWVVVDRKRGKGKKK